MNTMTMNWFAAPCMALAALAIAPASAPQQSSGAAWAPIPPQDLSDAAAWRELLEEPRLDQRERSFEALVDRAARSAQELRRLEALAHDAAGGEFAWSCRLALREARTRAQGGSHGIADPFEALRQRMFTDPFRADPFGGFQWIDPAAPGAGSLFDLHGGLSGQFGAQGNYESFRLEMGPDKVSAFLSKKDEKGEVQTHEYTARDLDELLEQHPELSSHLGRGSGQLGLGGTWNLGVPGLRFDRAQGGRTRTDVLGVYVLDQPADAADDTQGLRIEAVVPGTLASELGLQAGQVLLEINGRALKTRDDISAALRERQPEQALEVRVQDAQGGEQTKSWKPAEDPRGRARPLEPRPLGEVRKI